MVWYNLKVGNYNLKYTPLSPLAKEYSNCDKDGNELKKISGKFEKGYFLNETTQEKHDTSFKLINGKPYTKLSKTKEVEKFCEVDINEVEDLLQERVYLVEGNTLLNDLQSKGKALKFGFTNGNGFKVYKAYLYPSKIYKGFLFMSLGTTQISELVTEIAEIKKQEDKLAEITLSITGLNQLKVEDLLTI